MSGQRKSRKGKRNESWYFAEFMLENDASVRDISCHMRFESFAKAMSAMREAMLDWISWELGCTKGELKDRIYGREPIPDGEGYMIENANGMSKVGNNKAYWAIIRADDFCVYPDKKSNTLYADLKSKYSCFSDNRKWKLETRLESFGKETGLWPD